MMVQKVVKEVAFMLKQDINSSSVSGIPINKGVQNMFIATWSRVRVPSGPQVSYGCGNQKSSASINFAGLFAF